MKKTVLITGSSGFIGEHLKKELSTEYNLLLPSSTELDVSKKESFQILKKEQIDYVVHLAGKTFVPDSWNHPVNFFEVNTMGTLHLLEFCKKKQISMTYISAYIYGQPKYNPIPEIAVISPNNPYAKSKYMAEELCKFYCECFQMNVSVLRLFNVYGPGQRDNFLIPHIFEQVISDAEQIEVLDLAPKRDYIYISDVCDAIRLSIEKTKGFQLYNIGTGNSYSVQEIIDIIQKAAHTEKAVVSKNIARKNEMNDVRADIRKIQEEWNWKPTVAIEEGLKRILEESYEQKCSDK